jgi:LacI family transcriptional regulator
VAEKSRPTLADVARDSGLSVSAASLILNDIPDSGLSEDARRRVTESAQKLGYRPNRLAKALKSDKSGIIGFISDSVVTTRFASGLIKGALKSAAISDQVVMVLESMGTEDGMKRCIETALDHHVDALIIAAMTAKEISLPKIPSSTRVVLLNSTSATHRTSILPDEFEGGRSAMNLLVEAGFRDNIALIGKNSEVESDTYRSVTVAQRMAGIQDVCNSNNIEFKNEIVCENWEPGDGYSAVRNLLKSDPEIRALLCMNDRLAIGAYRAAGELGLRIPEDLSVVSFDHDDFVELLRPALTTVGLPYERMGEKAVLLANSTGDESDVFVPMPIFKGASVSRSANR